MTQPHQTQKLSPEEVQKQTEAQEKLRAVMLAFREVELYTTFKAEFAIDAGDIVFHFFKTNEVNNMPNPREYWGNTFAEVIEAVATKVFNTDNTRLKAQHIYDDENPYSKEEPLDSWWLRAFGFGHLLDPHALALKFLEAMDEGLEAALSSSRT